MKILTKAEHEKDIMSLGEVKEIIESIEAIDLECDDKTLDTLKLGTNVQSALENLLNYIYTLDTKVTLLANSTNSYEGGLGITVTNNTISHSNNLKADGSVGSGEAQEPDFGERATLGWFKYDLQGHVTFTGTGNILIPSADTAITSTSARPISSKAVYDNLIASKIRVTERSVGSEGSTVTIKDDVKTSLESLQNHIYHLYTADESIGKALTDLTGSVDKIEVSVGSTNVPIYFKDGVPTVCKYTLGSICTKSTTDYLSSTGGTVTGLITASGDVQVPSSKSTVGNSVPFGGSIAGLTALTGLSSYRSLIGSVSVSSTWYDVISVRHRNGHNDGGNYGMHIYSATTSTGDLKWNKQTASSTWQGARTILDSSNYKTYCTPANIGASASGHSHSVATTSANGFMSSTDKSKLDGIATGANKTVVDSSFSTTSTNPVQNKVVKNKIDAMDSVISTLSNSLQNAFGKFSGYLPLTGGTVTGTLVLSKTQDLSGTANNSPALIVGGTATTAHMEIDCNEIVAKTNGTTPCQLNLNTDGGLVNIGTGGLQVKGETLISHSVYGPLIIERSGSAYVAGIKFKNTSGILGSIGMDTVNGGLYRLTADNKTTYKVLDTGNYKTYCTPTNIGALATTIPTTQPLLFEKENTTSIGSATITGLFTKYKLILIEIYGSKDGRRCYIVPLLILKSKGSMCFSSSVKFNVRYTDDNTISWFEYLASGSENFTSVKIYAIY